MDVSKCPVDDDEEKKVLDLMKGSSSIYASGERCDRG